MPPSDELSKGLYLRNASTYWLIHCPAASNQIPESAPELCLKKGSQKITTYYALGQDLSKRIEEKHIKTHRKSKISLISEYRKCQIVSKSVKLYRKVSKCIEKSQIVSKSVKMYRKESNCIKKYIIEKCQIVSKSVKIHRKVSKIASIIDPQENFKIQF